MGLEPSTNEHKRSQMSANELPRFPGKFICAHLASFVLGCARLGGPNIGPQTPGPWEGSPYSELTPNRTKEAQTNLLQHALSTQPTTQKDPLRPTDRMRTLKEPDPPHETV